MGFSFVTVVSFVFEKSYHVKNGRADLLKDEQTSRPADKRTVALLRNP
jgi:hypothetical protein